MGLQADKGSVVVSKRRSGRGAERLVEKISAATPRATRDRSAARGPTARRRGPSHTCPLQKFLQRLLREQARTDATHACAGGASAASAQVWPAARGPRLRAAAPPPLTPSPPRGCRRVPSKRALEALEERKEGSNGSSALHAKRARGRGGGAAVAGEGAGAGADDYPGDAGARPSPY